MTGSMEAEARSRTLWAWGCAVVGLGLTGLFAFLGVGELSLLVATSSFTGMALPFAIAGSVEGRSSRTYRRVVVIGEDIVVRHRRATHAAGVASVLFMWAGALAIALDTTNPIFIVGAWMVLLLTPAAMISLCIAVLRRPCTVLSPAGVRVRGDILDAELGWDELVGVRVEESPAGVRVVGVPGASSYLWRRVRGVVPLYGRPGEGSIFLYDFTYDRPGVVAEVMETLARLAPERRAEYLLGPAVALLRGDHETIQES